MRNESTNIVLFPAHSAANEQVTLCASNDCNERSVNIAPNLQPGPSFAPISANETVADLNLDELTACCLAEPSGNGKYVACHRPASGIPLSEKLREMSLLKRFPFVYNCSRRHYYVCLYHRRIIHSEPKLRRNESLKKRDLSKYEDNLNLSEEEKQEMQNDPLLKSDEVLPKFKRSNAYRRELEEKEKLKQLKKRKMTDLLDHSGSEESMDFDEEQPRRSIRNVITNQGSSSESVSGKGTKKEKCKKSSKEIKNLRNDENLEDNEVNAPLPSELPMKVLPANTLRRYKKTFQLPHRSGTNTKLQLLEGISEHLATIQVPVHETIARFLYNCKMRMNKLDFPVPNETPDSVVGHYVP